MSNIGFILLFIIRMMMIVLKKVITRFGVQPEDPTKFPFTSLLFLLLAMTYYNARFDSGYNHSGIVDFSPCSYAFLVIRIPFLVHRMLSWTCSAKGMRKIWISKQQYDKSGCVGSIYKQTCLSLYVILLYSQPYTCATLICYSIFVFFLFL